jgi:hypothetical protein
MDATGAEILAWSIEQQSHWCQAESVLDGRQPATPTARPSSAWETGSASTP